MGDDEPVQHVELDRVGTTVGRGFDRGEAVLRRERRCAPVANADDAACAAKQWSACLAELDKARAADPSGDDAPVVKSLRDKAIAEILKKPEAPAP